MLADEWFVVAIARNKGVIKCYQYFGPINSETCKSFIDELFSDMLKDSANSKGKLFLQEGNPSQNSKIACEAMNSVGYRLFKIASRSPGSNLIENMFHLIVKQLKKDTITQKLEHKTYEKFSRTTKKTVLKFSLDTIDRTIKSMPKRIDQVLNMKGQCTKYCLSWSSGFNLLLQIYIIKYTYLIKYVTLGSCLNVNIIIRSNMLSGKCKRRSHI